MDATVRRALLPQLPLLLLLPVVLLLVVAVPYTHAAALPGAVEAAQRKAGSVYNRSKRVNFRRTQRSAPLWIPPRHLDPGCARGLAFSHDLLFLCIAAKRCFSFEAPC